jgi:hypothetical protein
MLLLLCVQFIHKRQKLLVFLHRFLDDEEILFSDEDHSCQDLGSHYHFLAVVVKASIFVTLFDELGFEVINVFFNGGRGQDVILHNQLLQISLFLLHLFRPLVVLLRSHLQLLEHFLCDRFCLWVVVKDFDQLLLRRFLIRKEVE